MSMSRLVHGIVSLDPPTIRCDGCGHEATGQTLAMVVQHSGGHQSLLHEVFVAGRGGLVVTMRSAAAERAAMRIMLVALIVVTLVLAVSAPLSGAFVAACGLLTLLVLLHHLARAAR